MITAKSVASSIVCSRLDYANSLLYRTTQKYQSATARPKHTYQSRWRSRSPTRHIHLVYLNIFIGFLLSNRQQRIKFKLATLTHITLCSTQPAYLYTPFWITALPYVLYALHSANANLLSVPRVHTTFASRGFSVAAPAVWNSLPSGIRDSSSTHTSVAFLKLTASSRPSAPPSGAPKCLRFGHCPTLCTLNIHLLTYLLAYTSHRAYTVCLLTLKLVLIILYYISILNTFVLVVVCCSGFQ